MLLNTLRIGRRNSEDHDMRVHFTKILTHHTLKFFNENDIEPLSHQANEWAMKDYQGIKLYCEFLARHRILNCKPYSIITTNKITMSQGFDIEEDELYTLQSLTP
jgi:hypothetical protein